MKADESKDLIERVGGLEAAQWIVERAPEGATDVIHIKPLQSIGYSYPETIEYSKDVDGERWHWNRVHGWFQSQMPLEQATRLTGRHTHIKLSDLRTAITEQRPVIKNCIECGSTELYSGGEIKEPRMCITCVAAMVGFTRIGDHFFDSNEIEQRPHPCATCPNHGHKACCHEVA